MTWINRCVAPLAVIALLAGPFVPGWTASAVAQDKPDKIEKRLRELETKIAAFRGLAFKTPVAFAVVPRPQGEKPEADGHYSPPDKTLLLYKDVKGDYRARVLIRALVHALQEQHFGKDGVLETRPATDAEAARAALIEGDASCVMVELVKNDEPGAANMLKRPLDKAKNLETFFLHVQGARYVMALKERGGWDAVNRAYRHPPRTTAAILHPEGVPNIDLGPGEVAGELGLIRMLHARPETASLAVAAAAGWRGDRLLKDTNGSAWTLAFATVPDASRFGQALTKLWQLGVSEAKEPTRATVSPDKTVWRGEQGSVASIELGGTRILAVQAADEKTYAALRERLVGPPNLIVFSTRDRQRLTLGELIDRLAEANLVCIGESHDSDLDHRVQRQIIEALFARDARLGVGMEMFQRPFQKQLDAYIAGSLGEEMLLQASEYYKRWGYDWSLYRPIVDFCRRNGVAVAALNAPRELTQRISKVGHAGLTDDEKKQLGPVDFQVKEHRDYWLEELPRLHGDAMVSAEQKERSYQVMTVWDEYMADSAARFLKERGLRRVVLLAGKGHVERGFGIPDRAARRLGGRALTVGIAADGDLGKAMGNTVVDFVVIVR